MFTSFNGQGSNNVEDNTDSQLLQLQHFPKIPKKFGTLVLLELVWFSFLVWCNNFFGKIFQCLDGSTNCFDSSSNAWNNPLLIQNLSLLFNAFSACSNRNFIWLVLPPLRQNDKSWLLRFLWYASFNRVIFWFTSEWFVISFFAFADGKLRTLRIIDLTCRTSLCYFCRLLSLRFRRCGCGRLYLPR